MNRSNIAEDRDFIPSLPITPSREEMIMETAIRNKKIYLASKKITQAMIVEKFGLSLRSVARIVKEGKEGKFDQIEDAPPPESVHSHLTKGLYKPRTPLPPLPVNY